jgi:hypothetical protein
MIKMEIELIHEGSYRGINEFVTMLRGFQVNEDLDALVGVSGFKGFGKSTFSKQVIIRYVEKYIQKSFTPKDLEIYTAYNQEDLFRLLDELPEFAPIDADEAVNFAMGEDWMKSGNKRMKKVMAKIRNKHHIFFFNIPDLWWLDKKYRENMMTIWIHIVKKGHAMVALPNTAPGIDDRWDRPWLQKAFTKDPINYFTGIEDIMKRLRKYSCFYDEFAFPKLPDRIYEKHLELRNARTLETPELNDNLLNKTEYKYKIALTSLLYNMKMDGFKNIQLKDLHKKYFKNPLTGEISIPYHTLANMLNEVETIKIKNSFPIPQINKIEL